MSHLNLETIARLVGDEPDTAEAAHLAACTECRAQLDAMTEDVHALALLPDMAEAPDQWVALERRLTDEGLIRSPVRHLAGTMRLARIAAAVVLFAGGTLAGRMSAQPPADIAGVAQPRDVVADPAPSGQPGPTFASESPVAPETLDVTDQPAPRSGVTLASNDFGRPRPATVEEAAALLRETETYYLEALTRFAELATQSGDGDPVARLAALQSIILTTQAALNEAPTDPVINGYHLTALAQRDATARQVAAASSERYY